MSYYAIKDIPKSERPRERLKEVGSTNLTDKELLAIILKTGTKNYSVTDLALELLRKCSLQELQEMTISKLTEIKGIGEVKAIELLATIELGKKIYIKQNKKSTKLSDPKSIWENSKHLFVNLKQECFYCLYFNNKQELLERKLLFMGTINQSITHPREVFKEAYRLSASSIVCMHNHPSGDLTPSRADISFTEKLIKIGQLQGIPILDHIIVGEDEYYSFYENNSILNS